MENPNELLQKIKQLESELKKVKSCKRYGLVWEDKPEIFEKKAKNALPILKEDVNLRIEDSEEKPNNIIIEGDNYHSLSALSYTHKGKIDVIYIDPPYNTGNKDFIYNDSFVDEDDSYRHSKWLSFMSKRLNIAKKLLTDNGLIFLSIDDNELFNLKLLSDEIFGDKNFLGNFIINSTPNARDYGHIGKMHDYCLFYGKNKQKTITSLLKEKNKTFTYKDQVSGFNIHPLYNSNEAFTNENRPNLYYPFYIDPKTKNKDGFYKLSLDFQKSFIEIFPPKSVKNSIQFVWRWGKPKSIENLNKEIIGYKTPKGDFRVVQKMRHSSKLIRSMLNETSFSTRRGTAIVEDIFQIKAFTFPKPTELIKTFLEVSSNKNSTILDFFAGSGTTGHAVMELNKEDGGSRQFILCSSRENTKSEPEKNICNDITYERNKRVIEGYKNSKGVDVEGLGGNLRYYTTKFVKADKSIDDLRYNFIDMCDDLLCIKENTFTEVKLKNAVPELRLFKKQKKFTAILYDIHRFQDLVKLLEVLDGKISVYIFSLSKDIFEEELEYLEKNITVQNIPDDILETYKKIFEF